MVEIDQRSLPQGFPRQPRGFSFVYQQKTITPADMCLMNVLGLIIAAGAAVYAQNKRATRRYVKELGRQQDRLKDYKRKYYDPHVEKTGTQNEE